MVDPEVGHEVKVEDGGGSNELRGVVQGAEGETEANVRDEDEQSLVGAEDGAPGVEVAHTQPAPDASGLVLLATLAGRGVEEGIDLPSEKLVGNEADDLADGSVLEELVEAGQDGVLVAPGLGGGNKGHILDDVASVAVVTVVAVLPGEVGDHEEAVQEPADNVVELGVLGEGTVAALVSQDPDAGADEALEEAVGHPGGEAIPRVGDSGDVGQGCPDEGGDHGEVTEDIVEGGDERGLEAVLGNGIANGLDVRELGLGRLLRGRVSQMRFFLLLRLIHEFSPSAWSARPQWSRCAVW